MRPRGLRQQQQNHARAKREAALRDRWTSRATTAGAAYEMFDAEREALLHLGTFGPLREKLSSLLGANAA
jgi:hypothetical protein